jgi:hypothetical protein
MLTLDQGRSSTLLGHKPDVADRPLRRDSGRFAEVHQLALSGQEQALHSRILHSRAIYSITLSASKSID